MPSPSETSIFEKGRVAFLRIQALLGRTPGRYLYDLYRTEDEPSGYELTRAAGSWRNALLKMGVQRARPGGPRYTDEELLLSLHHLLLRTGAHTYLTTKKAAYHYKKGELLAHPATYILRFGSWEEALRAARSFGGNTP
ncbi:MAG: hypothetical protein KM310_00280 [Clostridiales bacterium]|nr:hypothetical protein [Clostridiales bacterium]